MPPKLPSLKAPSTMGSEASDFLRAHQILPISPPVRSSDYRLCLGDPFTYYMARRLGVVPALSHSPALNRGTWMHLRFQHFDLPQARLNSLMDHHLGRRMEELTETCRSLGIQSEGRAKILAREEKDFSCSMLVRGSENCALLPGRILWRVLALSSLAQTRNWVSPGHIDQDKQSIEAH